MGKFLGRTINKEQKAVISTARLMEKSFKATQFVLLIRLLSTYSSHVKFKVSIYTLNIQD